MDTQSLVTDTWHKGLENKCLPWLLNMYCCVPDSGGTKMNQRKSLPDRSSQSGEWHAYVHREYLPFDVIGVILGEANSGARRSSGKVPQQGSIWSELVDLYRNLKQFVKTIASECKTVEKYAEILILVISSFWFSKSIFFSVLIFPNIPSWICVFFFYSKS